MTIRKHDGDKAVQERRVRNRGVTRKSASRRTEVLAISAALFARKGFEGTTMREISNTVGILPGSLYHHFTSKEEMLHEIMRPFIRRVLALDSEIISRNESPTITLGNLVATGLRVSLGEPAADAILVHDWSYIARTPNFDYLVHDWQTIFQLWAEVLRDGVESGEFSPISNILLVTNLIHEQISSTVYWSQFKPRESIEEVIETHVNLLLQGLIRRKRRR